MVVVVGAFVLNRTLKGFEVRVVGQAPRAARFAGFNDKRTIIATFALSGALASALGMLLFILVLNLRFPPDFGAEPYLGDVAGLQHLLTGGGAGAYLSYYGAYLLLTFLSGMFWAMTAVAFSAFYPNVALTLCAPPVMHRLLEELGYWTPEWLDVTLLESGALDMPPATILVAGAGVFCALSALLMLLFAWRAGRRLRYEA